MLTGFITQAPERSNLLDQHYHPSQTGQAICPTLTYIYNRKNAPLATGKCVKAILYTLGGRKKFRFADKTLA